MVWDVHTQRQVPYENGDLHDDGGKVFYEEGMGPIS